MPPLELSRFIPSIADNSKRGVLRTAARQIAADLGCNPDDIENALLPTSGASHTPLGRGVLVVDTCRPHIKTPYFLIALLRHPIDSGAPDRQPVDLVALMISNQDDRIGHLRRISALMRRLHQTEIADFLRAGDSALIAQGILDPDRSMLKQSAAA